MRLARAPGFACDRTSSEAVITQKAAKMKRFTCPSLNNSRVQFVMVSKHTLGSVIQKFVRIFPGSGEAHQNSALQHVFGTVAFESLLPDAASNFFHHVAL